MTVPTVNLPDFAARTGEEVGISGWIGIDQRMIDEFAQTTFDDQYIHVDPVCAASSPFGGTIAHGFLTLSLLSRMAFDALPAFENSTMGVNYGFNSLRPLAPVKSGARVRGRFALQDVSRKPQTVPSLHMASLWRSRTSPGQRWWQTG